MNSAAPRPAPGGVRRLAVVTHVVHHVHEGRVWAYAPYARELDLWAALFPTLVLVAPVRHGVPPGDCAPLDARNLELRPMPESGGVSWRAKGSQLVRAPWLAWRLWRQLAGVDAVHVRCPGNIGLLGVLVAPLRSRRLVAKYAGQWAGYPGEPRTVRLQRQLLRSRWWRGAVTVYGRQPDDPPHVLAFFTASLSAAEAARAEDARTRRAGLARSGAGGPPWRVLFVGRLSRAKRADVVIDAVLQLPAAVVRHCTIVGDGPERAALEARAAGQPGRVRFTGAVPFDAVLAAYEDHDVLVLVSETEGFPKVVAEARAFGLHVLDVATVAAGAPSDGALPDGALPSGALPDAAAVARSLLHLEATAARAPGAAEAATRPTLGALRDALDGLLRGLWDHQDTGVGAG